mmetsp:Transcript_2173/g.4885  ORF Transcript_2173/g.4885 Transcript_2173/m.4885 type:complete len:352 (-) Transcript_2173:49-1104(-)|eukprot:CAMPEP_0172400722 /NCGR_PEP_ID=MMETSP1061-20121228/47314_1 /TAXON_ID=37318 /ORGANISM="Pseudo-nitzschia pungens, Strain cf. pungens" /LENGTH=351 /DNA_ID=CAMNT_0013134087 /DNA_START=139 /DNA_END=1194 /DNA_ORIENTATION=+
MDSFEASFAALSLQNAEPTRSRNRRRNARQRGQSREQEERIKHREQQQRRRQQQEPKYSVDELRLKGLLFCGFTEERQRKVKSDRNERRFRGCYGVSSLAISKVVKDLIQEISAKKFDLKYFFLALYWLKAYPRYVQMEGPWNFCPETIGPRVKEYTAALQRLKKKKIKWFSDEEIKDDVFIVSVDGVHCRIQEARRDPGSKWYSHKSHGAALAYELGISVRSDRLVWINGPFPASRHDLSIFRYGAGTKDNPGRNLKSMIPAGKRAIADSAYAGEDNNTVSVTREGDSAEVKELKARAKSRHETFNSRIKSFAILSTEFRHPRSVHQAVMESVCTLVQYDIESGHGLFEL